jgi:hypothetical protein
MKNNRLGHITSPVSLLPTLLSYAVTVDYCRSQDLSFAGRTSTPTPIYSTLFLTTVRYTGHLSKVSHRQQSQQAKCRVDPEYRQWVELRQDVTDSRQQRNSI